MKTDVAIEKLCNVAPIIAEFTDKIAKDKDFKDMMNKYTKNANNKTFILKILPIVFKNYREDIYNMLAAWNDKSVDEIKEQPFKTTFEEIKAIWEDDDFKSFFSSSSEKDKTAE